MTSSSKRHQNEVDTSHASTLKRFVAGGIGGAVSRTAVSPLERLKILYMCGGAETRKKGVIDSLKNMWREEGFQGLMRGNGANVARIFPFAAIQMSSYPIFKSALIRHGMTVADREEKIATQLQPRLQQISPLGRFYAGVCAGVLATTLTYPLDFVRCRLSMQRADKIVYAGIVDGLVKVYRSNGGILSLYQGIVPTIIGIVPYAGIQLSVYDMTKSYLASWRHTHESTNVDVFVAGACAGIVAQTVAFPLELVRRRMQVRGFHIEGADVSYKASTAQHGFCKEIVLIVQHQGIRGLYRGLLPNYLKIIPAAGVNFLVFEYAKSILGVE